MTVTLTEVVTMLVALVSLKTELDYSDKKKIKTEKVFGKRTLRMELPRME